MAGGRPGIEPGSLPYSNVLPMWTNGLGEYSYYPDWWFLNLSSKNLLELFVQCHQYPHSYSRILTLVYGINT